MMKVLQINDKVINKGGVEVYVAQLQQLLPNFGCESIWIGIEQQGDTYRLQYYGDAEARGTYAFSGLIQVLKQVVEEMGIMLIHVHSISDPRLIRALLALRPVIRSMHEPRMFCPGAGKFLRYAEKICEQPYGLHCIAKAYTQGCCNRHPKRLSRAWLNTGFEIQEAAKRYHRIIAMSEYMKREAVLAGMPADKIAVNPYFTPNVAASASQVDAETKKILFIGRITVQKGLHALIEALVPLMKEEGNVEVEIVGDGPFYPQLSEAMKHARDEGLASRINFNGWKNRTEIQQYIQQAYLVAFPSLYPEAFGIVGIEAMMHAKPVVGFEVGGVGTWLQGGQTGVSIPVGDRGAMRQAMHRLLKEPHLYQRMAQAARTYAQEHFVPERHLTQLVACYRAAIHRNSAASPHSLIR